MSAQGYRRAASRNWSRTIWCALTFPLGEGRRALQSSARDQSSGRALEERRKRFGFCYLFACFWWGREGDGMEVWPTCDNGEGEEGRSGGEKGIQCVRRLVSSRLVSGRENDDGLRSRPELVIIVGEGVSVCLALRLRFLCSLHCAHAFIIIITRPLDLCPYHPHHGWRNCGEEPPAEKMTRKRSSERNLAQLNIGSLSHRDL